MKATRERKAAGICGLPPKLLKHGGVGEERQVERIMNAVMEGRRPVGRPRAILKNVLQRDLEASGLSQEEAAAEALNRDRWKTIVLASSDYSAAGS